MGLLANPEFRECLTAFKDVSAEYDISDDVRPPGPACFSLGWSASSND